MSNSISKLEQAAHWYAESGIPVFPLRPRDKRPCTDRGFKNATTDTKQISTWWTEHPQANIGVPTGAITGRFLFDCDFWNKRAPVHSRDELREVYGAWEDTAEVASGRGGLHLYFAYSGGSLPKQIDPGLELKGDGGYATVPPSIHPNGTEYVFDGLRGREAFLNPSEPPSWLRDRITLANARRPNANSKAQDGDWREGDRNTRLASLAGKLRRSGLTREEMEAALLAANRIRCVPPLPDAEVRRIAASIGKYPPGARSHSARINVDAIDPTVQNLNALNVFGGRLQFASVDRRGPMIVARFAGGAEAIWHSLTDLTSFARSQVVILQATGTLIPTPARRTIKADWEPAVQLLLRIAGTDKTKNSDALRDEFREILLSCWERAGFPHAASNEEFFDLLRLCNSHGRDPKGPPPRCAVWHDGDHCFVHQMSLIEWLSTPSGRNRHYDWGEVRDALLLLDFVPKQIHRSLKYEQAKARLWLGPFDLLVNDETGD